MSGNRLHREMLRYMEDEHVTVLAAGIASAMLSPNDTKKTVFACWWMALKYECIEVEELDDLLVRFLPSVMKQSVLRREAVVWRRIGWIVPRRNPIRDAFQAAGSLDDELERWLYRILFLRMDDAAESVGGWWPLLKQVLDGHCFPTLCQVVVFSLPHRVLTRLMKRLRFQHRLCQRFGRRCISVEVGL